MIISDGTILELIRVGTMEITPFDETKLTPNGYDFSIENPVVIESKKGLQLETKEYVRLPSFIMAQMLLRSSYSRRGLIGSFGFVDAGFIGKIRFYVFNSSDEPIEISNQKGVFQMIFMSLDKPALKEYSERSGHYQFQGIQNK